MDTYVHLIEWVPKNHLREAENLCMHVQKNYLLKILLEKTY